MLNFLKASIKTYKEETEDIKKLHQAYSKLSNEPRGLLMSAAALVSNISAPVSELYPWGNVLPAKPQAWQSRFPSFTRNLFTK
jgi:hypothetical protein